MLTSLGDMRCDSLATVLIERDAMLRSAITFYKNKILVTLRGTFLDVTATLRLCDGAVKALAELSD